MRLVSHQTVLRTTFTYKRLPLKLIKYFEFIKTANSGRTHFFAEHVVPETQATALTSKYDSGLVALDLVAGFRVHIVTCGESNV